jgi:hypothetical protein
MGHEDARVSERALREKLDLSSNTPIIPGPSLAGGSRQGDDLSRGKVGSQRSVMSLLLGGGNLRFDPAYAEQVLSVVYKEAHYA